MPSSMATTNALALTSPMPTATNAGPGQKPAMPRPIPKTVLPTIKRRSTCRATGSCISSPSKDTVRLRAKKNATEPTATAPPITLKNTVGSRIAAPAIDRLPCADFAIEDGQSLQVGSISLLALHTPGHTNGHFAYQLGDRLFSGDALLIDGCGRTDFQNGDAETLYRSVTEKLFSLSDGVLVYPAHDYSGKYFSTIGQEKARNPRLGGGRTLEEFLQIMASLKLPYPKFIDYAVPGNQQCGVCPEHLPVDLQKYCLRMAQSIQG